MPIISTFKIIIGQTRWEIELLCHISGWGLTVRANGTEVRSFTYDNKVDAANAYEDRVRSYLSYFKAGTDPKEKNDADT